MTVTNFYNDGGIYNEIVINGDNATIYANEKKPQTGAVEEQEEDKGNDDPLRMFLKDKEDYDYVLEWARLCKSPKDINNTIVQPLKKKGYGLEITSNAPFLKALLPYLTNFETSKNADSISRALRR